MDQRKSAIIVAGDAVKGTLFADPDNFQLWYTLYEELKHEVISVSPGRWLALPIGTPWSEIRWRMMTGQGWRCPKLAAQEALAWDSPIDHTRKAVTQAEVQKRRKEYEEAQPRLFSD